MRSDRGTGSTRTAVGATAGAVLLAVALGAVPALADFGDFDSADPPDPNDSPRVDTPNDANFDRCEEDDEEAGQVEPCGSYFDEQFGAFGFVPDTADDVGGGPTQYDDCSQLDDQGRRANTAAGDPSCSQLAGVRADTAWKYSTGDPRTVVAILDTGIEWQEEELVEKVHLNTAELVPPAVDSGAEPRGGDVPCDAFTGRRFDANRDGAVNVLDYACDRRVAVAAGDTEADQVLDASDLIARFSDDADDDGNGYVDDIAGWDFFDDDNDPFDASSCCSADGHGTGRALEAASTADEGRAGEPGVGEVGMCPDCQIMPLRVWDTFVVDTNMFALGTVYATDNGADVVEGAVGGLLNSSFARGALSYADRRGVALTLVSSDINSANHNYPTNYNEAIYVAGSLPDSAPSDCAAPSLPGVGDVVPVPESLSDGCRQFFQAIRDGSGGLTPGSTQPPTTSFFRNSNLTQYGGKADIVLIGATGSENTGQASGAAGLLASYGRQELRTPLTGNEIRQLLTTTAEDVLPGNTGNIGLPDKASRGWDPHFGYGRVNLAAAMNRIRRGRIPPEAQLDAPDWFAPINVDRLGPAGVPILGRAVASHGQVGAWRVEYACGQDAPESAFRQVPGAAGQGAASGELGRLSRSLLEGLADDCDGSVRGDAGRPSGRPGDPWPADPYPDPDPERHAFQIRLTVESAADPRNFGVYRKTLFAYRDDGNRRGWPRPIGSQSQAGRLITGSGGETAPRLVDLDRDNRLDVLLGTSAGELHALDARGRPLPSFGAGAPVTTDPYPVARRHTLPGDVGAEPLEPLRVPAVGDLTGDGEPEIVATAGEHVYAWDRRGERLGGFPVRIRPRLSTPCVRGTAKPCFDADDRLITHDNHIKRGFFGSPALADLDGDGRLDVVAGALDQHVYAWDGRGRPLNGFPAKVATDGASGAEIVTSPAVADLDGNGTYEIVIATNEVLPGDPGEFDFPGLPQGLIDEFTQAGLGSNLVYALEGDGDPVGGEWPVRIGTLAGDILPLVVPSNDAAAFDLDEDGDDEVAVAAATGQAQIVDGDGSELQTLSNAPAPSAGVLDQTAQVGLADYPSIGDLGTGDPLVLKGSISLGGVANLLAVNQNLPFNHSVQAWSADTGAYVPGYPVATDDFQLVSQPAIAKVGGGGSGRHALVGTGLYQLHAYGQSGLEPGGWPKFLGGWVQPTPAVGDTDGDGRLEVSAVTREGWSFLWNTPTEACSDGSATTNAEWWTFGHDEFGSHNYGTDARPPSRPGPISVVARSGRNQLLAFEASGDDLLCGAPRRYVARGSDRPIRSGADFRSATRLGSEAAPAAKASSKGSGAGGARQRLAVRGAGRFRFVAVRAADEAGNLSYVRSAATGGSDGERGGGGTDEGGPDGADPDAEVGAGPTEGGGGFGGNSDLGAAAATTVVADGGDNLPFTGLGLAVLVVAGVALLGLGARLARAARGDPS
jgi:hypothetical protein